MDGNSFASLLYLVLLGCFIGSYFVVSRRNLGKTIQQAAIWALIFFGAAAAAALWSDLGHRIVPSQNVAIDGSVEVPLGSDGHYHMTLEIDGTPIPFIVDTGASDLVLSRRDAERVGIDPDGLAYLGQAQTANGMVPMARVVLDEVSLGGVTEQNVGASVNGGEMDGSLLGMSYLSRFGRIEIEGGRLTLRR
ncbi:TIGR02281 family clan AA aspartic protease [Palleronia sp. LCG004]|uniref:retropepsin-like aspartic protease family protein n=1 Tax=Palleronia sp. LCG004 TaxID=3079304 RepID=UPI0029435690|nr:TIGR02281 family clan AA aspartic protease [Palleronia sp. LCG004]WOI55200.1 TIGR02281 family clan AA aspartic protease [Palleronia sp. LCG004]